jgi:hypothetical protein
MKSIFFLTGLVIMGFTADGQNADTLKPVDTAKVKLWTVYPGYIVKKNNDTVNGYLLLKNLVANQDKVFFYNTPDGDKKDAIKYKPKEIKAYKAGPRFYESFKFNPGVSSYSTNDANTYHFVIKTLDGPITLYKWYYETVQRSEERIKTDKDKPLNTKIDLSFNEDELKSITLGKMPDGKLVNFDKMLIGFKKKMSKLVADYPELSKKIAEKQSGYRWNDIEKIVAEYNEWYNGNHPDRNMNGKE